MESFKKGQKVQAVDEVGRWENGRIVRKSDDEVEVAFNGWPSH